MALANASAIAPSSLRYFARVGSFDLKAPFSGIHGDAGSGFCGSSFCVGLHAGKSDVVLERRRLKPVDTLIIENAQLKSTVEIPVSCYQLIGVPDRAEKDEIVKAVMGLKKAEIEEGYSLDVVESRLDLLMDVRDKLLFEPEYAGDLKEKIPPKSSLRIPWSWLPAALCLLHEVGESKLVLEIGRANLQHQDAKPYTDELLLSMALAECAIAKAGFEKNKVSQGFEALARAQCLLRSKPSLAKMTLLSQINKAKNICECLIASEGIDLKFEEAFCLFLLGQVTEADAVEKLKQLELNSNPKHNSVLGKAIMDSSVENPSLEKWLKDSALALFPDTKDCSPSLANFFNAQKKFPGSKKGTGAPQLVPTICHRPLSSSGSLERRDLEEPRSYTSTSSNLGYAVKQLTPTDLQNSLLSGKNEIGSSPHESPVQVNRSLGTHSNGIWDGPYTHSDIFGRITYITVLGCIAFATVKLFGMNISKTSSQWTSRANHNSAWTIDSSADCTIGPACIRSNNIAGRMKKIFAIVKQPFLHQSEAGNESDLRTSLSKSSSHVNVYRRQMPLEEAEKLVKQWQTIKAEALGPSHVVTCLAQVLDESMLAQWQALADAANERSCYWRFVLLKLSVLRADILSDGSGVDMAEIEALLEEAAELVDDSQQKNPNYYSTYKVKYILKRQEDGSWKFCEGDIRTP
ncbi:hypothetical protein PIB30_016657 [Stylosanthes scabra]|uniref:ARC6 IMS domain-containing protein n=1 Tax=Stylosanthes scabra TaxID=79078 RepID=A0ABU6WAY4_9FABA|nr:hypothetical protein [Stylosanthes scabra]